MALTSGGILGIVLAFVAFLALLSFMRKRGEKVMGFNKNWLGFILLLPFIVFIAVQAGLLTGIGLSPMAIISAPTPPSGCTSNTDCPSSYSCINKECIYQAPAPGTCPVQETAVYSVKDKFSITTVSGTSYYKPNAEAATTTAWTNLNKGTEYSYWVDNATYYVQPKVLIATCGANAFSAIAWANGTATVTGYDTTNHEATTSGVYNTSMGANDLANIQITYTGTAKQSAAPFGGVLVLEYNSTIASVTATGDEIMANPYHVTWSVSSIARTSKQYGFSSGLDDGSGTVRTINLQFKNGASAVGAGTAWYAYFVPANYYVTNNGDIVLDTEKFANDDTARTARNQPQLVGYWAA